MVSVWGCMSSVARSKLKWGEGSSVAVNHHSSLQIMAMYVGKNERARKRLLKSGGSIAAVAQTTDFCKTFSRREANANSPVALGTGPENNGNSYQHLCLWHDPSVLVKGFGSLCLEIKKRLGNWVLPTHAAPLKIPTQVGQPRPPQLSLPTACMEVANYLEVWGERKKCDRPHCVQSSWHIHLSKIYCYKNLQLYLGILLSLSWDNVFF